MSAVWISGRLVSDEQAVIGALDRGFTLGDGLFETLRFYGGAPFRLQAHLSRLAAGLTRIGIRLDWDLVAAVDQTIAASRLDNGVVRITVSRGPGSGVLPPDPERPTMVINAREHQADPSWRERGLRAAIASGRLNEHAATAGLKRTAYLDAVVAAREARRRGFDDALWLDTSGHVAEALTSNVFFVRGRELATPPFGCGILPGITRAAVLEIASSLGLAVRETVLVPDELFGADEAFLTSSLREIAPLVALEGRLVGDGRPGPLTRAVTDAFDDLVRQETGGPGRPAAR